MINPVTVLYRYMFQNNWMGSIHFSQINGVRSQGDKDRKEGRQEKLRQIKKISKNSSWKF